VKISELAFGEARAAWDSSVPDLISNDENRAVEFKQTARWNVREQKKDKLMEDIVAKTVAGFANANGGTLLVGVHDDNYPVGLEPDLTLIKPPTPDGFVNWMDTMLENRFGFVFVQNVTISTEQVEGHDVCRVNVPRATEPMWSTFKDNEKLFVRRNNSTRAVPDGEIETFIAERFGPDHAIEGEET
jgi:type I restriction enzyme R subunit